MPKLPSFGQPFEDTARLLSMIRNRTSYSDTIRICKECLSQNSNDPDLAFADLREVFRMSGMGSPSESFRGILLREASKKAVAKAPLKPVEKVKHETEKLEESLQEVVTDIAMSEEDKDLAEYLLYGRNFAGNTTTCNKNIIESIESIRLEALQKVDEFATNKEFTKYVKRCNKFFFGDKHARLDSFMQMFYLAELIDKTGKWIGGKRKITILGDMSLKGPYAMETMIYTYALQNQARKSGGDLKIVMGNNDIDMHIMGYFFRNYKGKIHPCVIERFSKYILRGKTEEFTRYLMKVHENGFLHNDRIRLYVADDNLHVDVTHAGIEKQTRLQMVRTFGGISPTPRISGDKMHVDDIELAMAEAGLTHERLADIMHFDIKENYDAFMSLATYCYMELRRQEIQGYLDEEIKKGSEGDSKKIAEWTQQIAFYKKAATSFKPSIEAIAKYAPIHMGITYDSEATVTQGTGIYFSLKKARKSLSALEYKSLPEREKLPGDIADSERISDHGYIKPSFKYFQIVGHQPTAQLDYPEMMGGQNIRDSLFRSVHRTIHTDCNLYMGFQGFIGFDDEGNVFHFYNSRKPYTIRTERGVQIVNPILKGKATEPGINPIDITTWRMLQPEFKRTTLSFDI